MQDVSEDLIRKVWARNAGETIVLVTLEADSLDTPIRVCSTPDFLTSDGKKGIVSRGDDFYFFPFKVAWGGASNTEPSRETKLEIANSDGEIALAIRTVIGTPSCTIEIIRPEAPDSVEMAMIKTRMSDAEVDDPKVTATLKPRSFADEPACGPRYTLARTPCIS